MTMHAFDTRYAEGLEGERAVLRHLEEHFGTVDLTSRDDQRRGRDFYVTRYDTRERFSVEVKTDGAACRTGNAFIEIETNGKPGRSGWAYTCTADWLLYNVTGSGAALYWIRLADLRRELPRWRSQYRIAGAQNRDYVTRGVCVPLHELEAIAWLVDSL